MVAYFCTIFIIITINIVPAESRASNINNNAYLLCSNLNYSCGKINNIGYPFWGDGRPMLCGRQEFKLFCPGGNIGYPEIELGFIPFWMVHVNTTTHTMTLVPKDFLFNNFTTPGCLTSSSFMDMASLDRTLYDYGQSVTNLTISYDCDAKAQEHIFTCPQNGVNATASYLDHRSCDQTISVPVNTKALEKLKRNATTVFDALGEGFEVEYKVNFTACSRCTDSGGVCASSNFTHPRWPFVCLCPNGLSPDQCPPS
ncbi:hypothetical protein Ancab_034799 [Ancistrocladus abbreviatus]